MFNFKKPLSNLSKLALALFTLVFISSTFLALLIISSPESNQAVAQQAPTEPTCQATTATPAFNGYPITTNSPNPDVTSGACRDIPLLSFFPVNTTGGNPREFTVTSQQSLSFQIYYNNSANPGSSAVADPNIKLAVNKINDTQFRVSATLSGSNTVSVTSAEKGGDLIINGPVGTLLDITNRSTRNFPDAIERKYESETTGRFPSDPITDNSTFANTSNPIYSAFPGKTLPSTAGFNFKPAGLEAGFLGYGYILTTINADPTPPNQPPVIPGQEITIQRGQSGSFTALNPTDPDNNAPITLTSTDRPDFCSSNLSVGSIITCQTDTNTPARSTFTITPTDSLGLAGQSGTFIVNVTEIPNLPPTIPGQEITIIRGQSGSFTQLNPTDPDNNTPITLASTDLLSFCTGTLAAQSIITCQTNASTPVRSSFVITPTDSRGLAGQSGIFIVNVTEPANQPPTLTGEEKTVVRGQTAVFTPLNGLDPDNNYPLTYDLTNLPSNCTVTTPGSGQNGPSGSGPVISCTTNDTTPTPFTFNIVPIDAINLRGSSALFRVNITEIPNLPPTIPGQEITIVRGQSGSFAVLNPTDPDNNTPITLASTDLLSFCTGTLEAQSIITCQTNASTPVRSSFVITPTDSRGLAGQSGIFIVNVTEPANQPPTIPGQEITIIRGQSASFTALNPTDPDNNTPITLASTDLLSFCTGTLAPQSIITCQTDTNTPVRSTFTITPTDSRGLAGQPGTFIVNITEPENLPPVLTGQELTVQRRQSAVFTRLSGTDPDNNYPLTYDTTNLPSNCTITSQGSGQNGPNNTGPVVTCTTNDTTPSPFTFNIVPIDSRGLRGSSALFRVIITEIPNLPPTLAGKTVTVERGRIADLGVNVGADPDNNYPLTYNFSNLPSNCTAVVNTAVVTGPSPSFNLSCTTGANTPTQFSFNITPTDSRGLVGQPGVFVVNLTEVPNLPPSIPGQEITIVRGQPGSFAPLNPTDPDNNTPITLASTNLPAFCAGALAPQAVITCTPLLNTPSRTTFTITPTDSRGLAGQSGTFIINVVDPGLSITKSCVLKGTETLCANLKPGDALTYKLVVTNSGQTELTNVKVTDNWDETKLKDVNNFLPVGAVTDTTKGETIWNLGTLRIAQVVNLSFDAITINPSSATTVVNAATASATGVPERKTDFTFNLASNPPSFTSTKNCIVISSNANCKDVNLLPGNKIRYIIAIKNPSLAVVKNLSVVDDYDQTKLSDITNIQPTGTLNTNSGSITWSLGDLSPNGSINLSFEATVSNSIKAATTVTNTAQVTADGIPPQSPTTTFSVTVPVIVLPRTGGFAILGFWGGLLIFGTGIYVYQNNKKLSSGFTPARNSEQTSK